MNPIDKLVPQLREGRLHSRPDRSQQRLLLANFSSRQQQQAGFFRQPLGQLLSPITEIADRHTALDELGECRSHVAVSPVAGRQHGADDPPGEVGEQMQLEAEKPAFARFAEVRAVFAQQPDPPVAPGQAHWQRLGIEQKDRPPLLRPARRFQHLPDETRQAMQAREPLLRAAEVRESRPGIGFDQGISAPQGGAAEGALHQGDGHDFSISEVRGGIIRLSPVRAPSMGLEVVVDKHVDFRQMLIYAVDRSSSSEGKVLFGNSILPS